MLYQRVRNHIQTIIRNAPAGDKLPTERDLSTTLRVNRGTVRRAIAELEKEGFVIRAQGRGTFIRSQSARMKRRPDARHRTISLIAGSLDVPFHIELVRGVEREADALGYPIWLRQCNLDPERELRLVEQLAEEDIAGAVLCAVQPNPQNPAYGQAVSRAMEAGRHVVLMDQWAVACPARVAMVDKVKVGYLPTEQLIIRGHRRICYLSSHTFDISGDESYRGYRAALADYRIAFDPALEINLSTEFCAEPARTSIRDRLLADPDYCTAVVTNSFSMGYGVMQALADVGPELAAKVTLVGNNCYWNPATAHLPHTAQSYEETGRVAMRMLAEEIEGRVPEGPRHTLIQPTLVWPEAGFPAPPPTPGAGINF